MTEYIVKTIYLSGVFKFEFYDTEKEALKEAERIYKNNSNNKDYRSVIVGMTTNDDEDWDEIYREAYQGNFYIIKTYKIQ